MIHVKRWHEDLTGLGWDTARFYVYYGSYFQKKKSQPFLLQKSKLANSFVNKKEITVHPTYAENGNLFIRVHINTNQDWFLFSVN